MILTIGHTKTLCSKFWKTDNANCFWPLNDPRKNEASDLQVHQISFRMRINNKQMIGVPMQTNYLQFVFDDSPNTPFTKENKLLFLTI